MGKTILDYSLVPLGLVIMVAYHIWLLYRVMKHPAKTVIGINAINRRFWVRAMMEDVSKNGVLAVQTLRNNIMASTVLASTAIMLSSLIAVLMSSGSGNKSPRSFVFGDRSELGLSVKFFSILVCFLVAFLLNVQSIRYYSHASILINVPFKKMCLNHRHQHLSTEYVARSVNRGSYFWSLGLRAYFPLCDLWPHSNVSVMLFPENGWPAGGEEGGDDAGRGDEDKFGSSQNQV
uniref:Uncharacterized protein n=1 Tax=Salix viminalis TaxID=40686 RepID=A0A6N2MFJ5_SALVM